MARGYYAVFGVVLGLAVLCHGVAYAFPEDLHKNAKREREAPWLLPDKPFKNVPEHVIIERSRKEWERAAKDQNTAQYGDRFEVQVQRFPSEEYAAKAQFMLQSLGRAEIHKIQNDATKSAYLVVFDRVRDRQDADQLLQDVVSLGFKDAEVKVVEK